MHRNYNWGVYSNNRIRYNRIAKDNTDNYYVPKNDIKLNDPFIVYSDKIIVDKLYNVAYYDKKKKEKINNKYTKVSIYH